MSKRTRSSTEIPKETSSRKRKKSYNEEVTSFEEFLHDVRNEASKNLSKDYDDNNRKDLVFMGKSIRALIATNEEIWERCNAIAYCVKGNNNTNSIVMGTWYYEEVNVKKEEISFLGQRKLTLTTQKKMVSKNFGRLPNIPMNLSTIIAKDTKHEEDEGPPQLPDYESYFRRVLLLDNQVLLPFLYSFQKHLEDVQVYLGAIEEWLSESQSSLDFLNDLFETNLEVSRVGANISTVPVDKTNSVICSRCFCFFAGSRHNTYFHDSRPHLYSKVTEVTPPSKRKVQHKRNLNCICKNPGPFHLQPKEDTLLSTTKVPMQQIEIVFDLLTDGGRAKLEAFLNFVKMYD